MRYTVPGDASSIINADTTQSNDPNGRSRQARFLNLAGSITTDSIHSLGCANAVLTYLQRRRSSAYIPNDPAATVHMRVAGLAMFGLRDTM